MLKKILPFTGLIAAVLAIVTLILMMACPVGVYTASSGDKSYVSGIAAIFGETKELGFGISSTIKLGWAGLLGWILIVVAILALIVAAVLQFVLKKKPQLGSILAIVAGVCAIVAGIFCFCGLAAVNSANVTEVSGTKIYMFNDYNLGAGWVIAGILGLCAGGVALINCILGIVASLKK